jgi:hypothetical protein
MRNHTSVSQIVSLLAISLSLALSAVPAFAAEHIHSLIAKYVSWGVDEYELYGLTRDDIAKRYKGVLELDPGDDVVHFAGLRKPCLGQPSFVVTFADGKIIKVKRLFIDGAGCKIWGPLLTSKRDALRFSVDGLKEMEARSPKDEARLKEAQRLLAGGK